MLKFMLFIFLFALPISYLQAQISTNYWEGHITHQGKQWRIAIEFENTQQNELNTFVDFIEIGGYRRLFTRTQKENKIHFERQQPNGRPPLIFDGTITKDSIVGNFEGIGIKGASFSLHAAIKPAFTIEDIIFNNDTVQLAGTLLIPQGKGPFAAVVFTHGSGPDTRNLYYGMAMDFVKKGIAALIYDKRGNGLSKGGDYTQAGFTDLAKDAIAGIQLLKTKKQINPKQIGVFGHSQGGWIAPMAAMLSKDVAFVITSAASAVTATEQSVYHRANIIREEGYDETAVQKATALRRALNAATKLCYTDSMQAKEKIAIITKELSSIKNEPWFTASALPEIPYPGCPSKAVLELLFKEPIDIWTQVHVPVYAVWGKQDMVVPVNKINIITDALKLAGNKHVTTKIVADTDHSCLVIKDDKEWDFPRESKGYFSDMAEWVKKLKK